MNLTDAQRAVILDTMRVAGLEGTDEFKYLESPPVLIEPESEAGPARWWVPFGPEGVPVSERDVARQLLDVDWAREGADATVAVIAEPPEVDE